jgi:hypothetical protein
MWEPRRLKTRWVFTACYSSTFTKKFYNLQVYTRVCIRNRGTNVFATRRSQSDIVSESVYSDRNWHGDERAQRRCQYLHLNWNLVVQGIIILYLYIYKFDDDENRQGYVCLIWGSGNL